MATNQQPALQDFKAPVKLKLAVLWTALMFCYIYADYLSLYLPGRLVEMNAGQMGPLGYATPTILVGVSIMMAIPGLMVCLSLLLPPPASRWANILLGLAYAGIVLLTLLPGAPPFYLFYGTVDILLSLAIVWCAWSWPRTVSG